MSERTLTTLDFVISVLREHEKGLTALSEKLEETLSRVSGVSAKKNMDDIQSIEILLERLVEQVSIQNQNFDSLIKMMRDYPTKKELEDLIQKLVNKSG